MKVFVWTYYGDTTVYAADTYEQCMNIFDNVDDTIYEMDMRFADETRTKLAITVSNARPEHRAADVRDAINLILFRFSFSEIFEHPTGFKDIENV